MSIGGEDELMFGVFGVFGGGIVGGGFGVVVVVVGLLYGG